jgi:CheY-like chemotaxis protein
VIDDNAINLKLLVIVLDDEGYEVRTARDAEEALAVLETYSPSLILMDLQLPGMDGLQLTRLLKQDPTRSSIRIIAVTSYAMKGDDQKAFEAGCDDYITKPISTVALPQLVARHLEVRP